MASEVCGLEPRSDLLTGSLLEGKGPSAPFLSLPPFSGSHDDGLCHQGQRPKTVEATVSTLNRVLCQLRCQYGSVRFVLKQRINSRLLIARKVVDDRNSYVKRTVLIASPLCSLYEGAAAQNVF
jgi:hypothetical protein